MAKIKTKYKPKRCILCDKKFIGLGYNPSPEANTGICCKNCYDKIHNSTKKSNDTNIN